MTPMHIRCPKCRAFLLLLVQLLPARATCTRCRTGLTIGPRQAIAAPPESKPPPVAPPMTALRSRPGRLLHAFVVLVLLAVLLGCGIAIVNVCFRSDPPVPEVTPSRAPVSPVTHHPISQEKRFRGN